MFFRDMKKVDHKDLDDDLDFIAEGGSGKVKICSFFFFFFHFSFLPLSKGLQSSFEDK